MKVRSISRGVGKVSSAGSIAPTKTTGVGRARGAASSRAAGEPEAIDHIAAKFRAGEVSRRQAVSLIVDAAMAKLQGVPPGVRRKMRAALSKIAAEDPTLLALLDKAQRKP
jgi:hypothetical protein